VAGWRGSVVAFVVGWVAGWLAAFALLAGIAANGESLTLHAIHVYQKTISPVVFVFLYQTIVALDVAS